jgi:hypothetical protein
MNNAKLLSNNFYWDDMESQLFNGVYNPKQNWHGWCLPYFTLGSIMRLKDALEKAFAKNRSGLRIMYGEHLNMIFYVSEPIMISDRTYWAVHERFEWLPEIEHNDRTR